MDFANFWKNRRHRHRKSRQKSQKEIVVFVTIGIADPQNLPRDIGLPKNAILGREYVSGLKFEPGDRQGSSAEVLKLDLSALDERDLPKGKVRITPVKPTPIAPMDETLAETEFATPIKSATPVQEQTTVSEKEQQK